MNSLRNAAQAALEALELVTDLTNHDDEIYEAITALRAALEQQAEPDAYGYASRLAVAIWEKHYKDAAPQWTPLDGLMGVLTQIDNMTSGLTRLAQGQAEPLNLRDFAVQKRLATQWGYVPAAQAEPVEPVAWEASEDGRTIQDNDFTHDVVLRVVGDFENDEQRIRYAQRIVDKLNAALVAAAEREACAALLEANGMRCGEESLSRLILETNAAAIRARNP